MNIIDTWVLSDESVTNISDNTKKKKKDKMKRKKEEKKTIICCCLFSIDVWSVVYEGWRGFTIQNIDGKCDIRQILLCYRHFFYECFCFYNIKTEPIKTEPFQPSHRKHRTAQYFTKHDWFSLQLKYASVIDIQYNNNWTMLMYYVETKCNTSECLIWR